MLYEDEITLLALEKIWCLLNENLQRLFADFWIRQANDSSLIYYISTTLAFLSPSTCVLFACH